jgi:hypothetical protein
MCARCACCHTFVPTNINNKGRGGGRSQNGQIGGVHVVDGHSQNFFERGPNVKKLIVPEDLVQGVTN